MIRAVLLAVAAAGTAYLSCGCRQAPPKILPEKVRLGLAEEVPCALPIIAVQKGFFAAEGLEVAVTNFVSGARALASMGADAVDVVTVAEVPVVAASFTQQDFRLFASIGTAGDAHSIVARRDAGITRPVDLRGKRVATQPASSVHFFLHLFLVNHGLSVKDVTLVWMPLEGQVEALRAGRIDAFSLRDPYVSEAVAALGTNAVVFRPRGLYVRTQLMAATARCASERPEALRRLVRGLLRAEAFARQQPDEARQIVAKFIDVPPAKLLVQWERLNLKVSLEQSLLSQMEDIAGWMLAEGLAPAGPLPNYLRLIDPAALRAVQPDAVTLLP